MPLWIKIGLYIGAGLLVLVALLLVTGVFTPYEDPPPSGQLVIWDIAERPSAIREALSGVQSVYRGVRIEYVEKDPASYEAELVNALASGTGPDIFVLSSDLVAKHRNKIAFLPAASFPEFSQQAPDVAKLLLIDEKENILGVPWSVDTLALYYNIDHLNAANIPQPPRSWEELREQSRSLTSFLPSGAISRAGISLGLAKNIPYAADIFYALLFQSGNPIISPLDGKFHLTDSQLVDGESRAPAVSALEFYTSFANPGTRSYAWNSNFPAARDAFAEGRSAFYIGYARDLRAILEKNSHLNFSVAPMPQLSSDSRTSHASFEFFTVSRTSAEPELAWLVLKMMYNAQTQKQIADEMALPPARRDLILSRPPNKILQPFYDQVLSARAWRIPDPDKTRAIINDMIDGTLAGRYSSNEAINRAQSQLQYLISQ